jgi:hypothetical protein
MTCGYGGMSIGRHDEVRDVVGILSQQALKNSAVRVEPMIHPIRSVQVSESEESDDDMTDDEDQNTEQTEPSEVHVIRENQNRGDLEVRGLDKEGISTIIDITVIDTDSPSYLSLHPMEVLRKKAIEKRKKHEDACKQNNKLFIPFVMSVDGCFDEEAKRCLKNIASRMSEKWDAPFSVVANYVYSRVSIALVKANNRCLRGSRVKAEFASKPFHIPKIQDEAALRAYEMLF